MMKNIYLILLLSILFAQCSEKNTIFLKYDLTHCADKWGINNKVSISEEEEIIQQYLNEEQGILIKNINILENSIPAETCYACTCKRGDVLEVEIEKTFELKLMELGFYDE